MKGLPPTRTKDERRAYYLSRREEFLKKQKEYATSHKEQRRDGFRKYRISHKKQINERRRLRRERDICFRISTNLRTRMNMSVRRQTKSGSAVRDLGCTISELRFYLEGKFQDGMTWENYGKWHIDHIIPLAYFDLTDRKRFIEAVHYTNLQPLWAKDNLLKVKDDLKLINSNLIDRK